MSLLIVIPAYNEESNVAKVIAEVHEIMPSTDVLVVNDGSSDDTSQIAKSAGARVIDLPFNLGVGAALRTGFVFAIRNGYTEVVQVDADGQHDPRQINTLLAAPNDLDVVVGSRFMNGSKLYQASFARRLAMRWLAKLMSLACRTPLTDVSSGFRLTRYEALKLFSTEYPPEYLGDTVESLVIAHRAGLSIGEVPVSMKPRLSGKPSQNAIKSVWYLIRATLVIFLALVHTQPAN